MADGELIKPATFTFGGATVCPHTTAPNLGAAPTMPPATGAAKDGELIKPATFIFDGATVATPLFGGSAASAAQTTPPPTPATGLKAPLLNGAPPPRPAAPNFGAATVATTMAHAAAAKGSAPTKAAKECTAPAAPARGAAPTKAAKAITMRVLQLQREYIAGGMGHVRAAAEAIKKASAESRQRAPKR